ncbi:transposase [Moorena sp. SIO3H5]|uniref:transposase n=1 Tax=Moorena sp. SIO3H5 TaxID=2607834 RepID=UPI0013B79D7D|nr:transposase [Moorena sp. SIO3H5]NEO71693.1 transposase [Moorena sp. SIO3H5]
MKQKPYPSDLSDTQWEIIEPLLPKPLPRGPKANVDLREVVNGIFYLLGEGCRWRAIPHDLPPWQTVSSYFRKWQRCSAVLGRQRGLGGSHGAYSDAARSWEGSAVLGRQRGLGGFPHERLPWFPP